MDVIWSGNHLISISMRYQCGGESENEPGWPEKLTGSHPKELLVPVERSDFIEEGLSEDHVKTLKKEYKETKREPYPEVEDEKKTDITADIHVWKVTKAKELPELVRTIPCLAAFGHTRDNIRQPKML